MFGELSIFDASLGVSMGIALFAGIISFLSPCVLPIVPPYLAYMAGTTPRDITSKSGIDPKVVKTALFFVLGLSTVFLLLGFAASALGRVFLNYQTQFNYAAGGVIILFGLHFLGLIRLPFLFKEARIDAGDQGGTLFGAYILGLAFAFGWTPCIGPILGAILSMAAQDASFTKGMLLMGFYAIGLGLPFLLAAIFLSRFIGVLTIMRKHMETIEKVMGVLLICVGILLLTGGFADISFWLLERFPSLAEIG